MPVSKKPKKLMKDAKKLALLAKGEKPKVPTQAEFVTAFRTQFSQFERIAQTIEGGLPALAQEVLLRTGWLWVQGDDMTREKFVEACGEVFDKTKAVIEAHNAKVAATKVK